MRIAELNVLIVEDDEFQRGIIANILASLGIASVSQAENGRRALEIIHGASRPIDVALCDLNMPEMDGMEFLRHLGEERQNISVILTSALDSNLLASVGRMTRLYGINLLGVMGKPVLLASLEALLSKHGSASTKVRNPPDRSFSLDEILQGIEADQFEPYFQPKVDLRTGRLVGAEALARWMHPEHGVVGPDEFIPHLERSGNIDDLTFRILEKSAAACRSFHEDGHLLTVSVNLSLVSLDDTSLADRITRTIRQSGVEPHYLVLEITESAAMTNVAQALENLARLCMNGFALSIDDYGTGSSNMEQLTRIAFSELKIDQSFVKGFPENRALRIVVESSIDMAHKLHVTSVAEGVESRQDWDALKAAGCIVAQGYFIAQPMEAKAFAEFAANYQPPSSPAAPPHPVKQQIRILVVDDDNFARKIVLRVLRDLGYLEVADAASAEAAIKLFETGSFDLILTDIDMPGMNGLKFIQMIRSGKTRAKPGTRVMVLTVLSRTDILGAALALDVNGFLVKPVIPAVVEEKLARAMTENLRLHSPIAYETVRTEPKSLDREPSGMRVGAAIVLEEGREKSDRGRSLALFRLRPGMVLKESVHLKDGTLILSAGHPLTELSINRLNDLQALLPSNGVVVRDTP